MYRLYFLDDTGVIQAREDFAAPGDAVALGVSDLLCSACSDTCHSYELWHGSRRVFAFDRSPANTVLAPTDQQTVDIQQITLNLEESLQRSRSLIARSEILIAEARRLKERLPRAGSAVSRILLVEDDNASRYATAKLLVDAGYHVAEAVDFHEALRVIEDERPLALLVLDLVLPGVSGFVLARMARMKRQGIKCIYTTGFDVPTHEAIGPVLRKPVVEEVLLAEIAKALAA